MSESKRKTLTVLGCLCFGLSVAVNICHLFQYRAMGGMLGALIYLLPVLALAFRTPLLLVAAGIVGGGGGTVHVRFHTETEDAIPQKMLLQLGDDEPISSDRISFNSQTSLQTGQISFLFPKKSEGDIYSEEEILSMLTGAGVTLTVVQAKVIIPAEEMQITSEDTKIVIK